jgi:DNA-binding response OmpR family regulator
MQGKKILIIEDDVFTRKSIEETFRRAGAVTQSAPDGQEGLRQFYQFQPHLVTLDLMMPHTDGWETCRQMRKLVDFVTKPYNPKVLLARARAALRQAAAGEQQPAMGYQDDYLTVDIVKRRVLVKGEPVKLTKIEYELLAYLVGKEGRVSTFEQILDNVWGAGYEDNLDYVHVYVSRLRRKIEEDPQQPRYLVTERGVGYRFDGIY